MSVQRPWYKQPATIAALILLLLMLLAVGILGNAVWHMNDPQTPAQPATKQATNLAIGAKVRVSGTKVPADIKARKVARGDNWLNEAEALTPGIEITPSGRLQAPITLRFTLSREARKDDVIVIATRQTPTAPETFLKPIIQNDRYAVVVVDHFSDFKVINLLTAIKKVASQGFHDITDGVVEKPEQPQCQNQSAARQDGYTIESSAKATVYWCFGIEGGKRVLKVVNRQRYPLMVYHTNVKVLDTGMIRPELNQLYRFANSDKHTTLYPGDTMQMQVNLPQTGGTARIRTEFDGAAHSLASLDGGLQVVSGVLKKLGIVAKASKEAQAYFGLLDKLMELKSCYNAAADGNMVGILRNCVLPAYASPWGFYSQRAKPIIEAIEAVGSAVNWVASSITGWWDSTIGSSNTKYFVTITRAGLNPFKPFVGKWGVASSVLAVKVNGSATYSWNNGICFEEGVTPNSNCSATMNLRLVPRGNFLDATYIGKPSFKPFYPSTFKIPGGYVPPHATPAPGSHFGTLRVHAPGVLKRVDSSGPNMGNPFLCSPERASQVWQSRCGW